MNTRTTQNKPLPLPLTPDKVSVYDAEGGEHRAYPVDAREMVAGGSYFHEKPQPKQAEQKSPAGDKGKQTPPAPPQEPTTPPPAPQAPPPPAGQPKQ